MKAARARLKKDPEVVGEGIPMVSASQKALNVGDVLYTLEKTSFARYDEDDDDDEDERKPMVVAHRVIQLNYQERYARIRCGNGCEQTLDYGESGCSKTRAWHDLDDVRRELKKKISEQVKCEQKEVRKYEQRIKNLSRLSASIDKMRVPAPAVIRGVAR